MIYLHKILPLLFSPLFFIISLIIIGIILKSKKTSFLGIIILIICSLPIVSGKLITYLESDYELNKPSTVATADAIVVLSGMVRTIKNKNGLHYEWNDAVDRIFAGIDLFKLNKAPTLILTRGKLPWSIGVPEGEYLRDVAIKLGVPKKNKAPLLILTNGKLPWSVGIPEGEYLKDFSIKYGIPEDKILLTDDVQNTDQEAKAVAKLLNTNKANIILVTSAFHMPRAKKVFEAANIKVIPFAVDFKTQIKKITIIDFIPSANSLKDTSHFFREMIGRLYYNLKY